MPRPRRQPVASPPLPPLPQAFAALRLNDRAERFLRALVLDGVLAAGDVVPLDEVGRHLGMSRQPLRDAATRLAADGLLEILPQIGCRVVRPDPGTVADFFRLFAAAEAVIVRLAAERRTADEAAAFTAESAAIAQAVATARAAGQDAAYRLLNRRFHGAMHALAGTPSVAAIAESLWDRSDFYLCAAFGLVRITPSTTRTHTRIAACITAGDGPAAEAEVRRHLESIGRAAVAALNAGA